MDRVDESEGSKAIFGSSIESILEYLATNSSVPCADCWTTASFAMRG